LISELLVGEEGAKKETVSKKPVSLNYYSNEKRGPPGTPEEKKGDSKTLQVF